MTTTRIDHAGVTTALREVLARKPVARQWAMTPEIREYLEEERGIVESSAWISARLREAAARGDGVTHVWLQTYRGAMHGGWKIANNAR